MGRAPCCEKVGLNRGPWTTEEDRILIDHINQYGHANWRKLPKKSGLLRCGKSCRLRWINYLRPDVKRGDFTKEEEDTLMKLQQELGNKWSAIAKLMPGRTDNEIKNVWNTHLKNLVDNVKTKKRPRKRSTIHKVVTQNNGTPEVQNAQNSRSDGKSSNRVIIEATSELTMIIGNQNSSSSSSSSSIVSKDTITNHNVGTSITSSEISGSLSKFLEIEDDFSWPDVMSTPSFDGNLEDDNMEFWYNIYTRDGSIEDLLQIP